MREKTGMLGTNHHTHEMETNGL